MSDGITTILQQIANGDSDAMNRLTPLVYDQLRRLAEHHLRGERIGHTLQATAIVHEAYVRLLKEQQVPWTSEAHFMRIAARCIRQILINYAKAHRAAKRGGDRERLLLTDSVHLTDSSDAHDALDLDEAIKTLRGLHERQAHVVEMRFFGGMSVAFVAETLGVSPRTVEQDWRFARAWLKTHLTGATDE